MKGLSILRHGIIGIVCACMITLSQCSEALPQQQPNILFAIADDWSWPHASAYGDPVVNTPAFDRIAREGILFEHAYVSAPSCTPSRRISKRALDSAPSGPGHRMKLHGSPGIHTRPFQPCSQVRFQ